MIEEALTVCQSIISKVVRDRIGEVPEECRDRCRFIGSVGKLGRVQLFERDRHGDENNQHACGSQQEHDTAFESGDDEECERNSNDQVPALICEIDSGLCIAGRVSHHYE